METLGDTGNKNPVKKDDSTITARITLKNAAAQDLDILIARQGISDYIYKGRKDGNKLQMYEYKVVLDANSQKLAEIALREPGSKRRKSGLDTRSLRAKLKQQQEKHMLEKKFTYQRRNYLIQN